MLTQSRLKSDDSYVSILHSLRSGMSKDDLTGPPICMLLTFSGHFRSRKEEILLIQEMQAPGEHHHHIELYGGGWAGVEDVFAMTKWWCDGKKTVPTYQNSTQFLGLFQLYEAAQILEVAEPMLEVIERRLNQVIETKIPYDEDLAEVYEEFPEGHKARQYTLDAWVSGYVSGRFDLKEDISGLFLDLPELQRDVNDAVAEQQQQWDLDEMRDRVEKIGEGQRDDEATVGAGCGLGRWGQVTLPYR